MPLQGVKCKSGDHLITIKFFDDSDKMEDDLIDQIKLTVDNLETKGKYPNLVAKNLTYRLESDMFNYGVPWFEVEVLHKSGTFFILTTVGENENG